MRRRFDNCWDRIERADAHRKSLFEIWDKFGKDDPYIVGVNVEEDGTGLIWVEPPRNGFPRIFALELGEMLYHLRSALDGSVYESAVLDSGKNPPPNENHLQFPIADNPVKFKEARRSILPLSGKRQRFIESIQPYNTPKLAAELMVFNFNRSLGILNDWARKDRHRKLHLVRSWAANISPVLDIPVGAGLIDLNTSDNGFLEQKSEVATLRLSGWIPGMDIKANPNLTIDVAIDEIPPPCADSDTFSNRIEAMFRVVKCAVSELETM